MNRQFILATLFSTILAASCSQQEGLEAELSAIQKFHDECLQAQMAGNVDCFAEDGQWLPPNAPSIKGRDAIGKIVSQLIEDPNLSVSHEIVDTKVSSSRDLAYIHYNYKFTMSSPDGNPVTEKGKAVHILRRQPEFGWKILIDIWNADAENYDDTSVDSEHHNTDVPAILDFEQSLFDAEIAGDFEAWMSFFAEDVTLFPPNRQPLKGKLAVRQFNAPIFEQFDLHESSDEREIKVAGNWAYIRAHWVWILTPKDGGEEVKDTGNSIWILNRQPDDSWKITRAIWNSDKPAPGEG